MKFGRYLISAGNMGDQAQLIGLDSLYSYMGINKEDTVDLHFNSLHTYRGEKVICPVYGCHISTQDMLEFARYHNPSPDVVPVFIGFFSADFGIPEIFAKFLSRTSLPILCRDKFSADVFSKWGLPASFWGCLSLLTPEWPKIERKRDTVFFEESTCNHGKTIDGFIPHSLRNCKIRALHGQNLMDSAEHMALAPLEKNAREYDMMLNREKVLFEHAAFVIASSLHLVLPCIAMGIPVLFLRNSTGSPRNIVPYSLYPQCDLDNFDPQKSPTVPDVGSVKKYLFESAGKLLTTAFKQAEENHEAYSVAKKAEKIFCLEKHHSKMPIINRGYSRLSHANLSKDFFYRMTGKLSSETDLFFYGAGEIGKTTLQYVYEFVKECRSFSFIDTEKGTRSEKFGGIFPILPPDEIRKYDENNIVIFITAYGSTGGTAENIARYLEEELNLIHGIHFYYYEYIIATMFQACFGSSGQVPSFYPPTEQLV